MIHHLLGNYYAVEVPEGAISAEMKDGFIFGKHRYNERTTNTYTRLLSNSASYTITALSGEITEEVAGKIVIKPILRAGLNIYINYTNMEYNCNTALESFRSLLTSRGIAGQCVVLEKIK